MWDFLSQARTFLKREDYGDFDTSYFALEIRSKNSLYLNQCDSIWFHDV